MGVWSHICAPSMEIWMNTEPYMYSYYGNMGVMEPYICDSSMELWVLWSHIYVLTMEMWELWSHIYISVLTIVLCAL